LKCANPAGIKVIEDAFTRKLNDQMHVKMRSPKGRKMRRLRQSTVEPVLGTLVNFTAMKQVNTKGISLANKGMIMAAVAYNLKKLINGISARVRKWPYRKTIKTTNNKHVNRSLGAIREAKKQVVNST